jgi:hypothetical protein
VFPPSVAKRKVVARTTNQWGKGAGRSLGGGRGALQCEKPLVFTTSTVLPSPMIAAPTYSGTWASTPFSGLTTNFDLAEEMVDDKAVGAGGGVNHRNRQLRPPLFRTAE